MANKYSEELFGAIDEIIRKRLQDLNKDTTILCNIEDNTNAEEGEYIVSNSGIRFTAYSDRTDYVKGQNVWILIPDGNYNNTKLIMGKYVSTDSASFTYVDPFASFIEMTPNLCSEITSEEFGLTANELDSAENPFAQIKPYKNGNSIIDDNIINNLTSLGGLARIGVSAEFKTNFLKEIGQPTSGNYGLHFIITTDLGKTLEFDLSTNSGMSGNLYGSKSYFLQKKTYDFNPEEDGNIQDIVCNFFQGADFNKGNVVYPYKDNSGKVYPNNIFVRNLQIKLGYSTDQIAGTTAFLWTSDGLQFVVSGNSADYTKIMHPRLAYRNSDGSYRYINNLADFESFNKQINNSEEVKEYPKIKFYKYNANSSYIDPRAGESWEEVEQTVEDIENFQLTAQLDNRDTESFKVLFIFKNNSKYTVLNRLNQAANTLNIQYNEKDIAAVQLIINKINSNAYSVEEIFGENSSSYMNIINATVTNYPISEELKTKGDKTGAIWQYIYWIGEQYHTNPGDTANFLIENDIYNKYATSSISKLDNFEKSKSTLEIWYSSKTLSFKNLAENTIIDLIQGLRLNAVDDKKGIYNIYQATENANSELIKSSDTFIKRNIEASFVANATQDEELNAADRIYWLIPKTISMIKDPVNGMGFGEYYNTITITNTEFNDLKGGNENNGDMILYTYSNNVYSPVTASSTYEPTAEYYIKSKSYLITADISTTGDYIKQFSELEISDLEKNFLRNNFNNFWVILEDRTNYSNKRAKRAAFMYQIKPIYRKSLTNNKIYAAVYKSKQLYTASIELYFGVKGVNDSRYTLTIVATKEISKDPTDINASAVENFSPNAWYYKWTNSYNLRATVYDSDDKEDNSFNFRWEWEKQWTGFKWESLSTTNELVIIPDNSNIVLDNYNGYIGGIIKCTAYKDNNDIIINQYYILPVKTNSLIDHVDGINIITYDNNNVNPKYYNIPYTPKTSDDKNINITNIEIKSIGENSDYIPTLVKTENDPNKATLVPTATFINNANYDFYIKIMTNNGLWCQPVLITLNNYSNSAIRTISATQEIKSSDDSSTISSVMSSISTNNNKITGVIVGSLPKVGDNKRTGILGYKEDNEIFGFFDNGTGFIDLNYVDIQGNLPMHNHTIADIYWGGNANNKVNANGVFAGPSSGNAAIPSFRKLVAGDFDNFSTAVTNVLKNTSVTQIKIGDYIYNTEVRNIGTQANPTYVLVLNR